MRSPVVVRVVRKYLRMVSKLSSGRPAQFLLISQNSRCSMGFHIDAAVGVVGHGHPQAVTVAEPILQVELPGPRRVAVAAAAVEPSSGNR